MNKILGVVIAFAGAYTAGIAFKKSIDTLANAIKK